ncbi:uncharacterized protein TNIN_434241 [Trichonephila inaurata madagascariensis]|uniref:Uncharacterized protein n=1 Tax=Trichonephila inaurata madagascariensis TaxID=2747483 RepID=A0A8X6YE71_9ARAC|nr:uncharacterized protein TNIN_434241 [Trichonephila inaurata madagascariensis]
MVLAKARIVPVKGSMFPRLELLGAVMGARIGLTILEFLHVPLKTYFWTDIKVVLAWIKDTEPWNTFVGNREKEIRELTNIDDWRHVFHGKSIQQTCLPDLANGQIFCRVNGGRVTPG